MTSISDDADRKLGSLPVALSEPHGRAAMLLVESLIHSLIGRSLLSVAEAVEIVGIAIDVEDELAHEPSLDNAAPVTARTLLETLDLSLSRDLSRDAVAMGSMR